MSVRFDGQWTEEHAWEWAQDVGPVRGCNYLPRTAVNSTEMLQAETFDPHVIDEELGWAESAGYNSLRVFIPFVVWEHDADGLLARLGAFASLADEHGMRVMWVLFDDCAFAGKEPHIGPQDAPVPGVHNSGWTPSPGHSLVDDRAAWGRLERYVRETVGRFACDRRVLAWDLYNEPGMSGVGERSVGLVRAAAEWVRSEEPTQPITVGAYANDFAAPASLRLMELSDVVSFHGYDCPGRIAEKLSICEGYGRPILCTECLVRRDGNSFRQLLPLLAQRRVGWYNWGLVAGRTQTYMPWGSKPGTPMPEVWQHDVFHADGRPFDLAELGMIRGFRFWQVREVVPTGGRWRRAVEAPPYGWHVEAYDDSAWEHGDAPFGADGAPYVDVKSDWHTGNIWMRGEWDLGDGAFVSPHLRLRHEEHAEVYINGITAAVAEGRNSHYECVPLTEPGRAALRPGGNFVAVHCHRTEGGQCIDVGLVDVAKGAEAIEAPAVSATPTDRGTPWSPERARRWYDAMPPIRGCNYIPRTAMNTVELWQEETFDPGTIDQELGWASKYGYNSIRLFLQYAVWDHDEGAFLERLEKVIGIAAAHGISVMPVFFDDVSFAQQLEPRLGPQDDPVVGIHNSGWVPSPGFMRVRDRAYWPRLREYVRQVVARYRDDPRVVVWDVYNEPGPFFDTTTSFPLAEAGMGWVRQLDPIQPVVVAVWGNPQSRQFPPISDVGAIHSYGANGLEEFIRWCHEDLERPVLCTEWLARPSGGFNRMLPLFAKHRVGWYHWGLVAGRTQTFYSYQSRRGDPMPEVWLHDTLRPNGTPYDHEEMDLLQSFAFEASESRLDGAPHTLRQEGAK